MKKDRYNSNMYGLFIDDEDDFSSIRHNKMKKDRYNSNMHGLFIDDEDDFSSVKEKVLDIDVGPIYFGVFPGGLGALIDIF